MSVDRPYSLSENSTAGFTISPHIAAIVQTDPYVDLYHYYRRRTLAKVPRHFSFFYIFLANRSFAIFTNIDTMGVVGHGLSTAAHGQKTPVLGQHACFPHHGRLPTRSVRSRGEIYITTHQGDLRGLSLPQHGATDIASTAAHGQKMPIPGQRA